MTKEKNFFLYAHTNCSIQNSQTILTFLGEHLGYDTQIDFFIPEQTPIYPQQCIAKITTTEPVLDNFLNSPAWIGLQTFLTLSWQLYIFKPKVCIFSPSLVKEQPLLKQTWRNHLIHQPKHPISPEKAEDFLIYSNPSQAQWIQKFKYKGLIFSSEIPKPPELNGESILYITDLSTFQNKKLCEKYDGFYFDKSILKDKYLFVTNDWIEIHTQRQNESLHLD